MALIFYSTLRAEVFWVSSQQEFDQAHDNASINDSIFWESGIYSDVFLNISKDYLYISSETLGSTIFTGSSRVNISGDYITFRGFQFVEGDIGTNHIINNSGSFNLFTQINIRAYTSYKYFIIRESSQYVEVTYCNFEDRLN